MELSTNKTYHDLISSPKGLVGVTKRQPLHSFEKNIDFVVRLTGQAFLSLVVFWHQEKAQND